MLKIIIVDDEPLYRKYLINSVEWEKYGFKVCCEAKNGIDALEKIREYKPDIGLVDINMPFMNGLELIEKIKEESLDIAIILVTGYNEFEYARQAVKLGAVDYILKPFDNEELMTPLLKVKEDIEKKQISRSEHKEEVGLMKDRLLNMLVSNEFTLSDEKMMNRLSKLGITVSSFLFRVVVVEIDNLYQKWNKSNEIVLWQFAVSNILNEITNSNGRNIIFNGTEGRIVSLIQYENEVEWKEFHPQDYERVCKVVKDFFDFTITMGVGRPVRSFKEVRNSYRDAVAALQNKLVVSNSRVIDYSRIETTGMNIGFYSSSINEKLSLGLKTGEKDMIRKELDNIFKYIRDNYLSIDYTRTIFVGLISLCLSYVSEMEKNIEDVFGNKFSPYSEINHIGTLEEIQQWLFSIYEKVIDYMDTNKRSKSRVLVKKVKDYIDDSLQDTELDLGKISGVFYMNSSYIRKIFKSEMGITISEYITKARMQKAKELLAGNADIAISQIAEVTGYSDACYFSKCFKKYTGMSPSKYANIKKI